MKFLSDLEFITLFEMFNSNPTIMAKNLGLSVRGIQNRRNRLEAHYKQNMDTMEIKEMIAPKPARISLGIENGTVIIFSDAHFWPGIKTTAYRGLIWAIQNVEGLKAIINNGDAFDGASISRFPRIGWDSTPSIIQ